MTLNFIFLIILLRYLRVNLRGTEDYNKWDLILKVSLFASIALVVAGNAYDPAENILFWVSIAALMTLLWMMYSYPEFKRPRLILIAVVPYAFIVFISNAIKLLDHSLYNELNKILGSASSFSVLWAIGTWFVIRNQSKELEKARLKALKEEENSRTVSAMNDRLEMLVAQRTTELTRQKEELEHALEELQTTQAQLIQSEKMASLGELTAGIAHEIQNPLNFVNNFSEVSAELVGEMKEEMRNGNREEVELIANDLEQNLIKIAQHGKRADAIVKSMLQHSRKNTGQLEPTNINALADEYLRLSYHGLRAKDKTFNATLQTEFDSTIGTINIVPQDMGRVLLNLFNNAFYAVSSKKQETTDAGYKPTVFVGTKKKEECVEITVKDNGNGIPQTVLDKIFQPFFTTKPTGAGTGLGLSLSYDIVTRQHGGTLNAETEEGKGATFIIELPFK